MVLRLALLCATEVAIVVLLAMQVFATSDRVPTRPTGPAPTATEVARPLAAPISAAPTGSQSDPAMPARTAVPTKWNAADPVGVLLTGTMRLRDGSRADANLSLTLDKERKAAGATESGAYALLGLHPGEWQCHLRGTAIVETTTTLSITDDAVQHHDFVLDPSFPVKVTIVTPNGEDATRALRQALPGWSNFAVAGQPDRFPDRLAPTDYGAVFVGGAKWSGEMNPKAGFAGTLYLASMPAYVALLQRHLVLDQQLVQPGQPAVEFVVDVEALQKLAGSAVVRVLDADSGEPLGKARVSLNTSNRGGGGQAVDAEGRAVVVGLSPGLLRCEITAPEHEMMYTTVRVDEGQRLELGDVRLGPAVPLQGTVLDVDGKPATVDLSWTELKWRMAPTEFSHNRSARVEADGTFSLWGTGRGAIAVTARDQQGNVAAGVFDNPPTSPIVLRLAKACECVVTRPADLTRAFTVTLFDGSKRAIAATTLEPRSPKQTIGLPAGDYTFEVHDDHERLLQSGALAFGATPCTLEIR